MGSDSTVCWLQDNLMKEIDKAHQSFIDTVLLVASKYFKKIIKPYLRENKLDMQVGNGDWRILPTKHTKKKYIEEHMTWRRMGDMTVDHETLPQEIKDILLTEVPDSSRCDLGCYMPDYKYKEENKENERHS